MYQCFDIKNVAILDINVVDYRCIIFGISKSEPKYLLRNSDLSKKSGFCKI